MSSVSLSSIGIVIIGRNEGPRLLRCLTSTVGQAGRVVYVDSGSDDGSQEAALEAGAELVALDQDAPFTAAKARNAGFDALMAHTQPPAYVQFIDGDCELQPGWIETAHAFLENHRQVAVACGRRRERFPEASVYNRLIDQEWDTELGETLSCGGDALMRSSALCEVGGFNPGLIAGEEPELCIRLRAMGWRVWRLDTEMTLHDAALLRLSQWWTRNRRAGFAFAESAAMHGSAPERYGVRETISAVVWGIVLPVEVLLAALVSPWLCLLALVWPLQVTRLALRDHNWTRAFFLTLGKFPEAEGVLNYAWLRIRGKKGTLIEYK